MIMLDVWLYGSSLARHVPEASQGSHAHLELDLPEQTTMAGLLARLGIPPEEKGITFVNGQLTDMPGLAADLDLVLRDGDRVGLFHPRSMWPFQYRFGATLNPRLQEALRNREGGAMHHSSAPAGEGGDR